MPIYLWYESQQPGLGEQFLAALRSMQWCGRCAGQGTPGNVPWRVRGSGVLTGLFWFAAIFGVGVTVIDLLGLIGGGSDEDGGDGGGQGDNGGQDGSQGEAGGAPVLSFLRWARTLVYFCLGFGPFGLAAGAFGSGFGGRLAWSLAGGAAMAVLARLFFRFQRTRLDSSLQDEELLMEPATVIVAIAAGGMGKVRVHFGQSVAERYARAEQADQEFAVDDRVIVSQVTDQCVYVRREDSC